MVTFALFHQNATSMRNTKSTNRYQYDQCKSCYTSDSRISGSDLQWIFGQNYMRTERRFCEDARHRPRRRAGPISDARPRASAVVVVARRRQTLPLVATRSLLKTVTLFHVCSLEINPRAARVGVRLARRSVADSRVVRRDERSFSQPSGHVCQRRRSSHHQARSSAKSLQDRVTPKKSAHLFLIHRST
jgi:hypothetical protein